MGELFVDYDDTERNPSDACVFCEIAKGTVPASMVFADVHVLAFLSLNKTVLFLRKKNAVAIS